MVAEIFWLLVPHLILHFPEPDDSLCAPFMTFSNWSILSQRDVSFSPSDLVHQFNLHYSDKWINE